MSVGIIEAITLMLGMSGFGLQANPQAPTADVSLQYALVDSDLVTHFDVMSVVPANYKILQNLPNQPQIKASADLATLVRKTLGEIEGARGLAKGATGIDLVTDVSDATMFVQWVPKQDPRFVAVVHGKFSTMTVDKISKINSGTVTKVGGGLMVEKGNDPAIGVTKDGVLIAGTVNLVRERLADTWKAPTRAPGSNLAFAAEVLGAKPVYTVILMMSPAARTQALASINGQNFATDLVKRHKAASFSIFHDGVGWTWLDRSKAGMDSFAMMSEGTIELFRAAQIAPRGFAKIFMGAIDSYRGTDKRIDDLIRRKADLLKIVESYTGDGKFQSKIDRDPKSFRVSVRATGKTLSEVIPAGFFIPAAVIGMLTVKHSEPMPPPPALAVPPPRPGSPGLRGKKP